ncbi:sorbitol dehydrogenase protein [Penicillium argentinense]|uniref:Sorbitol dehydrogenase protein n=1 Tax=Penicillium argentinense TaxID=1131581 RepID=A0A9W9FG36_9EURO|nr:sorbitol dehydrogenase protein [Penicillium argentinense]KAJ5099590.1 sorbitol dehydrogenase protein [Penicillium argentinense]
MASNVGMYIGAQHNLWLDEAAPTAQDATTPNGLQPGEVTIVKLTGICDGCSSDVHFWKHGGIGPWQVTNPYLLGHEPADMVIAVHLSVTKLAVGDHVAVEPYITCGACEPCLIGRYNDCKNLIFRSSPPSHGLMRRYVNQPATWCHKICSLSFDQGALLELQSVALTAVTRSEVKIGGPVLICGCRTNRSNYLTCLSSGGSISYCYYGH